ncbi:MAG: putative pre-16S rRNA nuclease [Candidatus Kapaibacterium sp.]|nr:MAG: putative pre-16S rRNA nuclease [Candidatus Kapabacteria bacterium]
MYDTSVDPRSLRDIVQQCRGAAFDYGRKRIGWAVCDEYHVTITPKGTFQRQSPTLWTDILEALEQERVRFCLVGLPLRDDGMVSPLMFEIANFARQLEDYSGLPVILVDESYTSRRAVATMVEIGVRRQERRRRGRTDEIAAALILRDFLEDVG